MYSCLLQPCAPPNACPVQAYQVQWTVLFLCFVEKVLAQVLPRLVTRHSACQYSCLAHADVGCDARLVCMTVRVQPKNPMAYKMRADLMQRIGNLADRAALIKVRNGLQLRQCCRRGHLITEIRRHLIVMTSLLKS